MTLRERLHRWGLGWRTFAAAAILAAPDVLTGLSGFDFNTILPGWGAEIGGWVTLVRIVAIPVLMLVRHAGRGEGLAEGGQG